ncbi:MAG: amidoligase family protein, partial [Bdellovibrionota bacterium]
IERFSEDVIPFEIVTPPIPLSDIPFVEDLRECLRDAGAKGTHARFFSAFGLQFNPEMPDFTVETLLSYQRAFFLLYDRLLSTEEIPLARRVLPFIDPFPDAYVNLVLDEDYEPTLKTFMKDYLEANPTRNRALDWLPLFAHLDRELTFSYPVEVELVKPRPTLHYRLPSSLIDEPGWSIAGEWNKWVEIERLASRPDMIHRMSQEFRKLHGPFQLMGEARWIKRSGEMIDGTI